MMNHQPEHHGVHVCHKCGWSFPNPHPNAKHRRAHKKVCGKIEGFKIVDSVEDSDRSYLTDPKNALSDDDRKSPESTAEGLKNDKVEVEVERRVSNRSEEELFADAISDFTDAGSSPITEPVAMGHPEDSGNAEPGQGVLDTPTANKSLQLTNPTCDDQFWSPDALSSSPEKRIQSVATLNESDKVSTGLLLTEECVADTKSFASVFINSMNVETCQKFQGSEKEHMPTTMTLPSTPMSECTEMGCDVNEKDGSAKAEGFADLPQTCAIRVTTASSEGAFVCLNNQEDQPYSDGHQSLMTEPSISQPMSTVSSSSHPEFIETENFSHVSQDCIQVDSKHEVDLGNRATDGVILAQDCIEIDPKFEVDPEDKVPYGGILTQDFTEFGSEHEVNPEDKVPDGGILAQDYIQLGPMNVVNPEDKVPDGGVHRCEIDKKELDSMTSFAEESSETPEWLQKSPNGFSSSISSNHVEVTTCDSSALGDHDQLPEGPQVDSAQEGEAASQFSATESCLLEDLGQLQPEFLIMSQSIGDTAQAPEGITQIDSSGQVAAEEDISKNKPTVCEEQTPGVYVISGGLEEARKIELEATLLHQVQEEVCEADGTLGKAIQESVDTDQNGASKDQTDDMSEAVSNALTEKATEDKKTILNGECAASNEETSPVLVEEVVCKLDATLVEGSVGESVHDVQTSISKDHTDDKSKSDSGESSGIVTEDKEATFSSECVQLSKETPLVQVKEAVSKVDGSLGKSIQEESVCSDQSIFVKDHTDGRSKVDSSITSERAKHNEETTVNGECIESTELNPEVHEVVSVYQERAIPEAFLVSGAPGDTDAAQAPKRNLQLDCAEKDVPVWQLSEIGTEVGVKEQSMEAESDIACAGVGEPREMEVPSILLMQEDVVELDSTTGPIMREESLQKDLSHGTKDYLSKNTVSDLNNTTEKASKENETTVHAEYIGLTDLGSELHDAVHERAQADLGDSVVGAYVLWGDEDKSVLSLNNCSSEFVNKGSGTDIECHGDLGVGEAKVNPQLNESVPLDTIITSEVASSNTCLFDNVLEPFGHQHQYREVSLENLQELAFSDSVEPSVVEPGKQVEGSKNEKCVTSKVDIDSCVQSVVSEGGYGSKDFSEGNHFSQEGCGDTTLKQNANASVVFSDASIDSMSQGDSVEGTWGSISGVNLETPKEEASAANLKKESNSYEGQLDHNDVFEPPSFMTLVDPQLDDNKQLASSSTEIQLADNSQKPTSPPSQAAWFPSVVHGSNESQGRKKNEEIIAKVVNWSSGKTHTPLRSLLVEASAEKKQLQQKVPTSREHEPAPVQDHDGSVGKPDSEHSAEPKANIKGVMEAEWNSPARLPISKAEKRKVRGKAYWVPFVCCSSVS
ncbi:uncharacterized protein [Aristolochia californica]|uniref:uncharacterized protein isoform X2 n=1 Tax=Aristolochia californica TaxID=171875 RepID=UPI0035D9EE61